MLRTGIQMVMILPGQRTHTWEDNFPQLPQPNKEEIKSIRRNAPYEEWTQAKMAFGVNKQDQNSQSLLPVQW